jgi:hypothetical protein
MTPSPASDTVPLPADSGDHPPLRPEEARALLRTCFTRFQKKLLDMARSSLESSGDLFEEKSAIPDGEVALFRQKHEEWLDRFGNSLATLFEARLAGQRRKGRRPDADASARTLKVLTPFDHEKQAALTQSAGFLARFTRRELAALDLRVSVLLEDAAMRELDNPFSVAYLLDALGSTARAVYPSPRAWRPLMERLLADMTPDVNKLHISLNRLLADHGVLPEIKAALRARSRHRPLDDRDLFTKFSNMLQGTDQPIPTNIVVPDSLTDLGTAPSLVFTDRPTVPPAAPASNQDFPSLDPLMALGTSTPLFAKLAQWQKLDLPAAMARTTQKPARGSASATVIPRNLIPHIREAIAGQISNPSDEITMDVIALLFDYIFRDPSIPEPMRALFGLLQVPIVKASLLDRSFFSGGRHAARQFLDHLADAAIGSSNDEVYRTAFEQIATSVIDEICTDFEIDVAVFRAADARLTAFVDVERRTTATALSGEVAAALAAEESESDRAEARAVIRDRLAGLQVPFAVRSFVETSWSEYLAAVHREHGGESAEWNAALTTLDETTWSIVVKERTGQKARLTKMIPKLVGSLRRGCVAARVPPDRVKEFFDVLYDLHMAAIKPIAATPSEAAADTAGAVAGTPVADAPVAPVSAAPPVPIVNVHDYASEMAVGTWLEFILDGERVNARLSWASPLRTKYIFTSRSPARWRTRRKSSRTSSAAAGRRCLSSPCRCGIAR